MANETKKDTKWESAEQLGIKLNQSEKERQMYNALCIDYTAAYCCDLLKDYMEPIKRKEFSHCEQEKGKLQNQFCYSEWIRHAYDTIIIKESAPDYLEIFDPENLMKRLKKEDSFVYRHKTLPNGAGMEYFETRVVRLYTDPGSFKIILGYRPIDDIMKEEKKYQEELEKEVTALRNIHAALGSGAWKLQYNELGEMTACEWSDTMRKMLGFASKEDFPDQFDSWKSRLHPEDREETLKSYESVVHDYTGQKVYDVEYRVCAKDGTYHWFRAAGQLSRREDGSPITFDGVFINTDEKHETNEKLYHALKETEESRNELLLEHEVISSISRGYVSIYSIDLVHDTFEEISRHAHSIHRPIRYGEHAQECLNARCRKIVSAEYLEEAMRFFYLATVSDRMGNSETIEFEYFATDGNWHSARFLEKKRDESGRVTDVLYVTRVISRQKQQEIEKERLRIAYEVAEKANEAKTTFLLNMSHDIRTPMNAILGYSQLMRGQLTDPKMIHYQEMIEKSGNLLLSILNNVLDMARIESGKMELDEDYCKAGEIVTGVCNVFEMEARKKNLTIEHIVKVEHSDIICDSTKMQEVLTNLISNAVKYTPPGGKIRIETQELPDEKDGYIRIQTIVEDNGIGMSEEFLPHLFDSFSRERDTTNAKVAGTGLGMSIVKSLVDLMKGDIEVESELGKGSKFIVTIPHKIANTDYYEKKAARESHGEEAFEGRHILLAEDNELNAEVATAILEEMGFTVDHAADGVLCVDKLEKMPAGTYDLILMDIQMPNMDGYKATQVIRRLPDPKKAGIPIVAMTANAFAEDRKLALEKGMNGHIAKPIDVAKIKETFRDVFTNI